MMADGSVHLCDIEMAVVGDVNCAANVNAALRQLSPEIRTLIVPGEPAPVQMRGLSLVFAHFDRIVTESGVVLKDKHAA